MAVLSKLLTTGSLGSVNTHCNARYIINYRVDYALSFHCLFSSPSPHLRLGNALLNVIRLTLMQSSPKLLIINPTYIFAKLTM